MRVAIAGFVVPYMAVYAPALMMQAGTLLDTAYVVLKALITIGLWGAASVGFLWVSMPWYERILALVGAFALVVASPVTDQIGFAATALVLLLHWRRRTR